MIYWELLDRYLSGEESPDERARVEAWLADDPERWAQLTALRVRIRGGRTERVGAGGGEGGGLGAARSGDGWGRGRERERGESGRRGGRGRESRSCLAGLWFTAAKPAAALDRRLRRAGRCLQCWCSGGAPRRRRLAEAMRIASYGPAVSARCYACRTARRSCWAWRACSGIPGSFAAGSREVSL